MNNLNKLLNTLVDDSYITSFLIMFFVTYGSILGSGGKPPEFLIIIF